MINENKTFEKFGYYSTDLKSKSDKKIIRICNSCGKEDIVRFRTNTIFCRSCYQRGERSHRFGKIVSIETKKKMSNSHKGKIISLETRQKMSIAKSGKNHPFYNKHHIEESKNKMSISTSKENNPNYGKFGNNSPNWKGGRRISQRKHDCRRADFFDKNPIELNNSFIGSHGHHIDSKYIINIPAELHRSIFHRQTDGLGMEEINKLAFEYLYENT